MSKQTAVSEQRSPKALENDSGSAHTLYVQSQFGEVPELCLQVVSALDKTRE